MSKKTLLMLSAAAMFGAALVTPSAALAQFGPPGPPPAFAGPPPGFAPSGPPPGLGAGGPPLGRPDAPVTGLAPRDLMGAPPRDIAGAPPHFSRLGGAAGLRGLDRGGPANFRGVEGRAAAYSANYQRVGYAGHGYGHGRGYRYWPYAAAAAYAHGGSYASSDDGCYYVSAYRRNSYRRVLVCPGR
jgi:hypothetical protein